MNRGFAACAALIIAFAVAAGHEGVLQEALLEPDKAFRLSTRVIAPDLLEARWDIADGYYMYRHKFKFELLRGPFRLQTPEMPSGQKKEDPLFGRVETYIKRVAVRLPLVRETRERHSLILRITAQGCNEPIGVCYQPMTKEVVFNLQ
jgi:thioredoxin:protein disulfide reductase